MARRISIALLVCLALLIAALLLSYIYRVPLAQSVAEQVLDEFGVPLPRLKVQEVDWTTTRLTDIGAGDDQELAVAQVIVIYDPRRLLGGKVERVAIEGLRLKIDGTGDRPALGSLAKVVDALATDEESAGGAPLEVPELQFRDARIDVLTKAGALDLAFEGTVAGASDGTIQAALPFSVSGLGATVAGRLDTEADPGGAARGRLVLEQGEIAESDRELAADGLAGDIVFDWRESTLKRLDGVLSFQRLRFGAQSFTESTLDFDLTSPKPTLDLKVGLPEGRLTLALAGELAKDLSLPKLDAKLDLHLAKSSSLWQLSGIEPAPRGAVSLQLDLAGSLPSLEQFSGAPHAALEALLEQGVTGQMALKSDEVTLPGWSDGVTANLAGEVTVAEEAASLILSAPANITIPKIDEERLRDFGLDPAWLEGGLALDLAEGGRIAAERSGATAELAGKLAAGKTRSLAFDGKFGGNRDMIDIDDLAITAESGPLAGTPLERLELAGHLSGRLSPGQSGDGPQGLALPFHELSLSLTKLAAALNEGLPEPLSLAVPEVTLSSRLSAEQPFAAKLALTKGTVNLPGRALELNGLALTADLDSSGLAAPMTLAGQAIDKQAEPLFNPLGFKAEVVQTKQSYALNGEVYLPKGAGPLRVAGHYGLDSRKGELALDLDSLSFIKSLVQPVDLSPRLALLSDVSGSASMTAEITLDGDTRRGTALIGLNGMGFTLNDVKFEDLNLSLALNELEPPASPPDQDLTARAIDPGVPIEDLAARYQLLPGDPAKIKIEEATFRAAGGRFRLADTLIDPAAETNRVVLEVVGLDLADLLKDYPVDGLTVTGLMTGVVPVTLSGDQLAIEDANLEAQGPGLLQFRSDSANQALASGGDPVALMLEALEDFQYETLDISAFKDAEHNTQMLIEILGNNPNVLDGYPFKFNINLSGNMGPIVSALTRGYEISNDLIRRSWKLSP